MCTFPLLSAQIRGDGGLSLSAKCVLYHQLGLWPVNEESLRTYSVWQCRAHVFREGNVITYSWILISIQETSTSLQLVVNVLKCSTMLPFYVDECSFPILCRMSGNTAAMAAPAPGPALVLDPVLVHALAAEAGTTSLRALQRY